MTAAPRHYDDFVLELRDYDAGTDTYTAAVLPSRSVGESSPVPVRLNRPDLAVHLDYLDRKRIDEQDLMVLGEGLTARLLPEGEVRRLFVQALRAAGRDGGVRLRLLLRDPALAQLPWEYAYLQLHPGEKNQNHFLVLNPQVSLVRHEARPEAHPPLTDGDGGPVRFVVAMANPSGTQVLNLDKERAVLDTALAAFGTGGRQVEWEPVVEHATGDALRRRLAVGAEVFHFAGHGGFRDDAVDTKTGGLIGSGYLLLESDDAQRSAAALPDRDLALLLKQSGARLAFLGACGSGRRDGVSAWSGVAPALVQQGVAAVVAMQYDVYDELALAFVEMFYAALSAGLSVDEAMAAGRLGMKGKAGRRDFDWGVPVLYMRSPDGVLFAPASPESESVADNFRAQIEQVVATIAAGGLVIGLRGEPASVQADVRVAQKVDRVEGTLVGVDLRPPAPPTAGAEPPQPSPAEPPLPSAAEPPLPSAAEPPPPPAGEPAPMAQPPPPAAPSPRATTPDAVPADEEKTAAEATARWLQARVSVDGSEVEHAFVAGQVHRVDISIGRQGRIRADAPFPAPPEVRSDGLLLTVRLVHGADLAEQPLWLPRDPLRESTAAAFDLAVAAGETVVTAVVAVYHESTILQAATLQGPAVADLSLEPTHAGAITLTVEGVRDVTRPMPARTEASVLTNGSAAVAVGRRAALSLDAHALGAESRELVNRIEAAADLLAQGEDELGRLMLDLAFHGRRLHASIGELLGAELQVAQRLQIVATDPTAFLPLELVYDGPQPTNESQLCPTFREALEAGSCAGCEGGGPEGDAENPRVCPMRFWGLAKVIERHAALAEPAGGGTFDVRSERVDGRQRLRALSSAVVGSSERVSPDELAAVVASAQTSFGQAEQVGTWSTWIAAVKQRSPAILVALPHHELDTERDPAISCLELGQALLPAGGVSVDHVGSGSVLPGPVLVLLGCNTGQDDTPIDTFAGEFRRRGASIVVSTLGEVIPEEASDAAQALLTELAAAVRSGNSTLGDALLRVRRALLARNSVLGLLVVGHGDADWLLPEGS